MDLAAIAELDRRFGIPGIARVVEGNGGLAKVAINTREAAGEIYLHGAHVTSWQPRDADEVLFVSSKSRWEDGRAIRGGVPICFPWFADKADDPSAPAHGFVRTKAWQLESIVQAGDAVTVSMFTESNDATKQWWPADFHLVHRATFGSELNLELVVRNTGATSLRFEEATACLFPSGTDREGTVARSELSSLPGQDRLESKENSTRSNRDRVRDRSCLPWHQKCNQTRRPCLRRRIRRGQGELAVRPLSGIPGPRSQRPCPILAMANGCRWSASRPATSLILPWSWLRASSTE